MSDEEISTFIDRAVPPDGPDLVTSATVRKALQMGHKAFCGLIESGRLPAPVAITRNKVVYTRAAARSALRQLLAGGAA